MLTSFTTTTFSIDQGRQLSTCQEPRIQTADTIHTPVSNKFVMKVANQPAERKAAFKLCNEVYCKSGLTDLESSGLRVMRQHLVDTTRVLIASTPRNEVVFTVTLVGDGEYGLPMESLFGNEVEEMRASGTRLAEV